MNAATVEQSSVTTVGSEMSRIGWTDTASAFQGESAASGIGNKIEELTALMLDPVIQKYVALGLMNPDSAEECIRGFQEAIANAVDHGCLELQSKWKDMPSQVDELNEYSFQRAEQFKNFEYAGRYVGVTVVEYENTFSIIVKDQGKGFDLEAHTAKEKDLLVPGGFGMMFMGMFYDCSYADGGRELTLTARLPN